MLGVPPAKLTALIRLGAQVVSFLPFGKGKVRRAKAATDIIVSNG